MVSTTPGDGSANLDTVVTFTITFNTAIDTSARFPFPGDFFLNILLQPDSLVGEPDTIYISPDLKTVTVENLTLAENTTYYFVIVDAVSQSGDSLDIPYVIVIGPKEIKSKKFKLKNMKTGKEEIATPKSIKEKLC